MTPELLIAIVAIALIVYLIATHKIDLSKLKGELQADLAKIHATTVATHAAALAPVSVVPAPSDSAVQPILGELAGASHTPPPTHDEIRQIVSDALAAAPAGSAVANNAGNALLAAYAASGDPRGANAGGNAEALGAAAAGPAVDRWSRVFDLQLGSLRYWKGIAGEVISTAIPIPAGWRGSIMVQAAEAPQAGVKVNQFDCWVSATPGGPVMGVSNMGGPYASFSIAVTEDYGTLYANVRPVSNEGGGLVEIQPHQTNA
jgi:hypothetical protein